MPNSTLSYLKPLIPQFVLNELKVMRDKRQYLKWKESGSQGPPPHLLKQITIRDYQRKYGYNVLVETGTYMGDMIQAQKSRFKKIFSIELATTLYEKARNRFKGDKHITIVQGDSGKVLPSVINEINEPAIFWLDGHYSSGVTAAGDKECPINEELDAIFNGKPFDHVILIDDARLFTGKGDYPTVEKLTEFITQRNRKYHVEIENDILRYIVS